ncbi:MAG: sulfite exporter TauE/SafE family protein [Ignavibacteria bacterium]|nr:sulfite exporter TauE/SafE family protein [Ignavibacteria bacterium]
MSLDSFLILFVAIFTVAFLYSSVGHAGASGYIAVMTLFGLSVAVIKPSALVLNIAVACLTSYQFWKAGHFSWKLFFPFAMTSVPFAFLGGYITLPTLILKIILGVVLLYSALRFMFRFQFENVTVSPSKPIALSFGAIIGLISGITGVGGGIFLTPLLLLMKWAKTKTAAAVSAVFILVNSVAGIVGSLSNNQSLPLQLLPMMLAALCGGAIGSYYGSRKFSPLFIKKFLAVVLTIAGMKLMFT